MHLTQCSPIDVRAGETKLVALGGTGWIVTGKIQAIDETEPVDWPHAFGGTALTSKSDDSQPSTRYFGLIDASGAFAIDDVPGGTYDLSTRPFPPDPLREPIVPSRLQPLEKQITVPDAIPGIEPANFDLGVLEVKSNK